MRHNWMRPGRDTLWDMRRRAALRAWNDEQTWVSIADWLMGWGVLIVFLLAGLMILAAWMKLGV